LGGSRRAEQKQRRESCLPCLKELSQATAAAEGERQRRGRGRGSLFFFLELLF
jgi:hypothetical protein